jgi:arsenate reductase (thioredoxin)
MPTIVFLCVANAARSQMAEGLARATAPAGNGYRFFSAGSQPGALHPLAVRALAEEGIDIAHYRSKGLDDVPLAQADVIVTLCADEVCPFVPGPVRRLHWPLPDPADLEDFRAVRDELRDLLPRLWSGQ